MTGLQFGGRHVAQGRLDQGIDLGCKGFAVVCWVEFPCLKEGSSTKAILSGDGERHHLALWRADAHGAIEAGMISENRYKPFTPVSRDAPSLDRLTGWHMLALVGSAAEVRRRAALSAVIFGSNFGANTACIGSLGGLMMRRLALQQGVTVTNGMLLRQGIPVMIPTMLVACFVLVHQTKI